MEAEIEFMRAACWREILARVLGRRGFPRDQREAPADEDRGGGSEIRILVSDWKVERGVANSQDVAMATKQNRVALTGRLDLVNQRFDDVTMALIDARGCATVKQKISGSFQKPVVEKPDILMSLAGPAVRLLKKGRDLFPGAGCEVFYAGSVVPPI